MKSTLKLFAMLMLVTFMASCSEGSDELGTTQSTDKEVYMTFSGSTDPTLRTVINSTDNSKIDFAAGDAISVFDKTGKNCPFTTIEGGNVALFGGDATPSDGYTLLYPYQDGATISEGGIVSAVIPAEQVATVGTFDPKANLSIAKANRENAFKLLNVCSLIRFNVIADYDFVTLTDVNGRYVAGAVTIDPTYGTATYVAEKASKSVTLTNLKAGNVYYIALLPGEIKLNLKFMTTDGKSFVKTKSGDPINLGRSKVLNIGKITAEESEMTQEWVDLNLPSGLKWATCNVGATTPENIGDYYGWGEIIARTDYSWGQCKYEDQPDVLPLEVDAAHVVLGGKWRMPTETELEELRDNCYTYYTDNYAGKGFKGTIIYKVKDDKDKGKYTGQSTIGTYSENDVHIFMPISGYITGNNNKQGTNYGYYRTSTINSNNKKDQAWVTSLRQSFNIQVLGRTIGMIIRPVYDKNLEE